MRAPKVIGLAALLSAGACEKGQVVLDGPGVSISRHPEAASPLAAHRAPKEVEQDERVPVDAKSPPRDPSSPFFDLASLPDPALGPPCDPDDHLEGTIAARSDQAFSRAYRQALETGRLADGITVTVHFCGDLRPLLALGFTLFTADLRSGSAWGLVRFFSAERLVQHPGVRRLSVGEKREIDRPDWW